MAASERDAYGTMAEKFSAFARKAVAAPSIVERARRSVADCFGCILAGADSAVAGRLRAGLAAGADGTVPIYGTDRVAAPGHAALVNAAAGHAHDLDDWEEPGNTHPTVVILPACLAAAHLRAVSGGDLLRAYAVGFEITARLGEVVSLDHYARGFHSTATLGAIAAAAAVCRILDLTVEQGARALSLAASQAVGYTLQFGSNAKPFQAGAAARAGLESALLARAGTTAQTRVLEDARGFAGLMGGMAAPLKPLGDPWALEEYGVILKPWPSCGYTHRLMTAALELRDRLHPFPGRIRAVTATQPDFHNAVLPFDRPAAREEALFSAPACIAQTLVHGDLTLADGETAFWRTPEVRRLIEVTEVIAEPTRNPALNYDPDQPDRLTVRIDDADHTAACALPLGAPGRPMSDARLAQKFASITRRPKEQFDRLLDWPDAADAAVFFKECAR